MDLPNMVIQYIKPELLILIPVLWWIGTLLKKSEKVQDWKIPFYLLILSVLMATWWVIMTSELSWMSIWVGVVQGVLIALVEGQGYQYFKQVYEKKEEDL